MTRPLFGLGGHVFRSSAVPVAEAPAVRHWMRAGDRASPANADPFASPAANTGDRGPHMKQTRTSGSVPRAGESLVASTHTFHHIF